MEKTLYLICTTPRSGSNLLCSLLSQSGMMGRPGEYLNPTSISNLSNKHGLFSPGQPVLLDEYLNFLMQKFSSKNNVFGLKVLSNQFEPLINLPPLKAYTQRCKLIWLSRRDVIAQAISMYIASETDAWKSIHENSEKRATVEYDEAKLARSTDLLTTYNLGWMQFFAINQVEYLSVTYEDLVAAPNDVCHQVCNFCGVYPDHTFSIEDSPLKKQGDDLNERFAEMFRQNSALNLNRHANAVDQVTLKHLNISYTMAENQPLATAIGH